LYITLGHNSSGFGTMKLTIIAKRFGILPLVICALLLAACSGLNPTPSGTPTLSSTATPTPTIIWFPATNTPTLFPTQPPTQTEEYHPGIGDLLFSDSFDQPDFWNATNSAQASASLIRNRLVLSINEPGPLSILSMRSQPVLGDFYAQATVDISLCNGKDQYGMIFRASTGGNYYRLTVNCGGQLRLERVRAGETYPLLDWLSSGDAPTGAPSQVKLGVWAVGREMRVFLNDHYQFNAFDPVFTDGTLGFFIFASGQTPVTVSFSDLSVYSVSYISPTPSLTPTITFTPSRTPTP
jgi:hypothetical protein